jgi:hypothetical protein
MMMNDDSFSKNSCNHNIIYTSLLILLCTNNESSSHSNKGQIDKDRSSGISNSARFYLIIIIIIPQTDKQRDR